MTSPNMDAAVALIKEFEGCKLNAYPDPGSGAEPFTIGFGHTGGVNEGDTITQDQAEQFLRDDLSNVAAQVASVAPQTVTANQLAALISFTYNLGFGNLRNSTLVKMLWNGDTQGAADQFPLWNHSCGAVLPGLVTRRAAERALFLTPDDPDA